MLESLEYIFDAWSQSKVSNQHILHKVYKVDVVVNFVQFILGKEGFTGTSDSKMKLQIIGALK